MLHLMPCTWWSYSSVQMSSGTLPGLGLGKLGLAGSKMSGVSDFDFFRGFLWVVLSFPAEESSWARRSTLFSILALNFRFLGKNYIRVSILTLPSPFFSLLAFFLEKRHFLVGSGSLDG
jgi:hypothetical protein